MGSTSSKVAKAASNTPKPRQYPSRVPPSSAAVKSRTGASSTPDPISTTGPTVHPTPHASESKDQAVTSDAQDPDFAASLRSLGPVQPNSTLSNTSTFRAHQAATGSGPSIPQQQSDISPPPPQGQNIFPNAAHNPALVILEARTQIAEQAEQELTQTRSAASKATRRFLDVMTIRQVLSMRDDQSMGAQEIENTLHLSPGTVGKLALVGEASVSSRGKEDSGIYD
ncbi:uncharacterized protein KY384_001885 [Bacidia gigantensis]|uniref:uncharacterized protein n=1 Tax=Bacidia gigantensis TaxID=2732470 RepID=UPI001D04D7AE|nr:uncharacterized protein KY384_001885 [Bacidia gigantensis]KAG8533102.1 hypothetical protein KY384_001885 [Bacidia gigantensis]